MGGKRSSSVCSCSYRLEGADRGSMPVLKRGEEEVDCRCECCICGGFPEARGSVLDTFTTEWYSPDWLGYSSTLSFTQSTLVSGCWSLHTDRRVHQNMTW